MHKQAGLRVVNLTKNFGSNTAVDNVTFGVPHGEVFALLEQPNPGPWRTVLGIVADFLTVRREYAPLIDLALGPRASHFVVRDPVLLRAALEQRGQPFAGRVSFYPLPPPHDRRTDFQSVPASRPDGLEIRPTTTSAPPSQTSRSST